MQLESKAATMVGSPSRAGGLPNCRQSQTNLSFIPLEAACHLGPVKRSEDTEGRGRGGFRRSSRGEGRDRKSGVEGRGMGGGRHGDRG